MKQKIYLIGNLSDKIDLLCEKKYYDLYTRLLSIGFSVINPIERLTNLDLHIEEAKKRNLQDLMSSSAVYIMPCVRLDGKSKNIELSLALSINLIIISGLFNSNSDA